MTKDVFFVGTLASAQILQFVINLKLCTSRIMTTNHLIWGLDRKKNKQNRPLNNVWFRPIHYISIRPQI